MSRPGGEAGHDEVFAEVLSERKFVRRFAARCGVRSASLDDFVQDVVLTAWKTIMAGKFDPPDPDRPLNASVRAWLAGIVKRKAADWRKAKRKRDRLFIPHADVNTEAAYAIIGQLSPEDHVLSKESLALLEQVKLSPMALAVVFLVAQGYTETLIDPAYQGREEEITFTEEPV